MERTNFLSKARIARWSAVTAGVGAVAIAGYHLPLPGKLQWRAMIGDPTVGWGIEMLNFAVSELMLIGGVLTVWAAYRLQTDTSVARVIVGVTGCYWVGNAVYQWVTPMPLPEFLAFVRWVLICFALVMASLHLLTLVLAGAGTADLRSSGRVPYHVALFVLLVPIGTWACAEYLTPWPAVRKPTTPAASVLAAVSDLTPMDLGLPELADVTGAEELRVTGSGTDIPRELYLAEWPWLSEALAALDDGRDADGRLLIEEFLLDPARSGAAQNVLAGVDRRNGSLDVARKRIESALSSGSGHVLHHYQDALCHYAAVRAAEDPMKKWMISKKVQAAYQKVFDARPETEAARYFLIQCFAMTPAAFGGDPNRALALATEAIAAKDHAFLPIRGRLYERQDEYDKALTDYDLSVDRGIFEVTAFVRAIALALSRDDLERARRYVAFAVAADSQSARVMEAAGDYFVAAANEGSARKAYGAALRLAPARASAGQKLAALGNGT